jgi:hypothetical protein
VNGSGFTAKSVIRWNGSARATVFVSGTELTATIHAADVATASTAQVTVANPGPPAHISNPVPFNITTPEQYVSMQSTATSITGIPTLADLNGDGIPVTYNGNSTDNVVVYLGTGDGQFGSGQFYSVSGLPVFIAVGDFNGDGKPDLAVAATGGVQILHNLGNGTFGGLRKITNRYLSALAVGDFNGDGWLDLAGTELGAPAYVYAMLNNAGKGFAAPVGYVTNDGTPVIAADFNRDGLLDLAVLNYDDSISILLGNGDGTFQPQTVYPTGSSSDFPTALIAADVNGDGIPDLVRTAALYTAGVGVLLGNGDGTFQPVQINIGSAYGVVAADFNGDGKLDLAVGGNGPGAGILFGNGDGTFQPVVYFYGDGSPAFSPALADFNNNGRADLALDTDAGIELLIQ